MEYLAAVVKTEPAEPDSDRDFKVEGTLSQLHNGVVPPTKDHPRDVEPVTFQIKLEQDMEEEIPDLHHDVPTAMKVVEFREMPDRDMSGILIGVTRKCAMDEERLDRENDSSSITMITTNQTPDGDDADGGGADDGGGDESRVTFEIKLEKVMPGEEEISHSWKTEDPTEEGLKDLVHGTPYPQWLVVANRHHEIYPKWPALSSSCNSETTATHWPTASNNHKNDIHPQDFLLKTHMLVGRSGGKLYSCTESIATFSQPDRLTKHAPTHAAEQKQQQTFTESAATVTKLSDANTGTAPSVGEKLHSSTESDTPTFVQSGNLRDQTYDHTESKQQPVKKRRIRRRRGPRIYCCTVCESKFTQTSHLKAHILIHTGERRHSCTKCLATFTLAGDLKKHMRIHTGEKPYSCSLCEAAFTQSSSLKDHIRKHTGEKPYSCTLCPATFTCKSTLKTHMRRHTGEKPYSCKQCEATFSHSGNLKAHMRRHTGEKPHSCEECEATFTQLGDLKKHMRIHTGEKPYSCSECGSKFTQSGSLTVHMRTHTGEKPYSCTECDATFPRLRTLRAHMLVHTPGKADPYSAQVS